MIKNKKDLLKKILFVVFCVLVISMTLQRVTVLVNHSSSVEVYKGYGQYRWGVNCYIIPMLLCVPLVDSFGIFKFKFSQWILVAINGLFFYAAMIANCAGLTSVDFTYKVWAHTRLAIAAATLVVSIARLMKEVKLSQIVALLAGLGMIIHELLRAGTSEFMLKDPYFYMVAAALMLAFVVPPETMMDQLKKLETLKSKGELSEEEYNAQRADILSNI